MKEYKPETMNVELTTKCPLRCPQCYCSLSGGKNIDLNVAKYWILQGAKMGVKNVELSGGETLCYPYLAEIVSFARKNGVAPNIAISGYNFTQRVYDSLMDAGVNSIFVSLNGSSNSINSLTRDGFNLALSALKLLKNNHHANTFINWVMHENNVADFSNLMKTAEELQVKGVVILALKPTSSLSLETLPDIDQMKTICDIVNHSTGTGNTRIYIETCYSPLLAMARETKFLGNLNTGYYKGCAAGLSTFSVNVDGFLSPCRHLDYFEQFETLEQYWNRSKTLIKLRELANSEPTSLCSNCRYKNNCRPCYASVSKLEGMLYRGNPYCPVMKDPQP